MTSWNSKEFIDLRYSSLSHLNRLSFYRLAVMNEVVKKKYLIEKIIEV